jgi:putative SOS response-associated peptidase YedK
MCFTIEVHLTRKAIEKRFAVDTSALYDFDFRYFYSAFANPLIPVITQEEPDRIQLMEWGLIPSWVKDREKAEKIRKGTYNARSESLHEKPSFRDPLIRSRCLVLAHGFFEWQLTNGEKVPWYIRLKDNAPFAFAGLYDRWIDPEEGRQIATFSIITTRANPLMEKIHNTKLRMPAILPSEKEREWIENELSIRQSNQLLLPLDEELMHAHTISSKLSKSDTDPHDAAVIEPFKYPRSGTLF